LNNISINIIIKAEVDWLWQVGISPSQMPE